MLAKSLASPYLTLLRRVINNRAALFRQLDCVCLAVLTIPFLGQSRAIRLWLHADQTPQRTQIRMAHRLAVAILLVFAALLGAQAQAPASAANGGELLSADLKLKA